MNNSFIFDFEFKSNGKHHVTLYKNRIEIEHHGAMNKLVKGTSGKVIIYLSKLSAIEIKTQGLTTGYIEFMVSGMSHTRETMDKINQYIIIRRRTETTVQTAKTLVRFINAMM